MSTKQIASDLEELQDEIHQFDYSSGNLITILNNMVDRLMELNDEIAKLQEPKKRRKASQ